jgi:hypothetical protein
MDWRRAVAAVRASFFATYHAAWYCPLTPAAVVLLLCVLRPSLSLSLSLSLSPVRPVLFCPVRHAGCRHTALWLTLVRTSRERDGRCEHLCAEQRRDTSTRERALPPQVRARSSPPPLVACGFNRRHAGGLGPLCMGRFRPYHDHAARVRSLPSPSLSVPVCCACA